MANFFTDKPLATASATVSAVIAILGAFWALDSHYATAADVQTIKQEIMETKQGFAKQVTQMRSDDLDDKIFALQLKKNQQGGKLSAIDEAMLERYQRQEQQVQDQIKALTPTQ
jgi:ClpP class serine protease